MSEEPIPSFRVPLFTRGARIRLSVAAALLAAGSLYAWFTMLRMPGSSYAGALPPLTPEQSQLEDRLRTHVDALATRIGARSTSVPAGLARAVEYVDHALADAGYTVTREPFRADGMTCVNLVVERRGSALARQIVVIGAHYDSVYNRPAANDNASGTAALIELARAFARENPARTVRFVAFTNEEPHHFQQSTMGSLVNARSARARGDDVVAMLSLETIGYYDTRPSTQQYPPPLSLFYPDRGDFIAFVSRADDVALVRRALSVFRTQNRFPSEGAALPEHTQGIGWSDHWSYWQAGYSAIMVTDSAPFRDPNYHTMTDTADKLDFARMTRVVSGLLPVVRDLASAPRASLN